MAALYERRSGPRKLALEPTLAPYSHVDSVLPGAKAGPASNRFVRSAADPGPLPASDADIAFASVAQLSRWIQSRKLTATRLAEIYLRRIEQYDPKLRCVITLTREHALVQAKQADAEIAAGKYRGPLHGIPWGAKDLVDSAGIPTTYGAEPYRNRVPEHDAAVVKRLNNAGAVLIAKLSLGALALNDIWFGGPVAARRRLVGLQRRAGRGYRRGACGVRDRQRNRRQYRQPQHALRSDWTAADVWASASHRRDDAVLVAG